MRTDARKKAWGNNLPKWEARFILPTKVDPFANQLYKYRKITIKYNGNHRKFSYHYISTPYNSIYGPQKSQVKSFQNGNIASMALTVVMIRTNYQVYTGAWQWRSRCLDQYFINQFWNNRDQNYKQKIIGNLLLW